MSPPLGIPASDRRPCGGSGGKNLILLIADFLSTVARLLGPGGTKTVVAENLLLKHQLLIVKRSRRSALNLNAWDRLLLGHWTLLIHPGRLARSAVILKSSMLLPFHRALVVRKYRLLVLIPQQENAWAEGSVRRNHPSDPRNQTEKPPVWPPEDCPSNLPRFWRGD